MQVLVVRLFKIYDNNMAPSRMEAMVIWAVLDHRAETVRLRHANGGLSSPKQVGMN
jgi:hypothetical protein